MSTRPTLAYVCADPGVPVFGTKGSSVHVQELLRAWRARGYDVRLYCVRTGDDVPADLADVPVVHVPVPSRATDGSRLETAGREQRIAATARELTRRVVSDGADVVHERYSLFSTVLAQATAALEVPGVLEVNAPLLEEQRTYRELVDEDMALRMLRTQVAAASVVTTVSEPVAAWVRDRVPGTPRERVRVVPNGVDTERIGPVRPDLSRPTVVFVGTVKPWHGVEDLVDAAALARQDWRVRIVGHGPAVPAVAARAAELGVELDLRGAVPPQQVPEHLAGACVAVAPYPAATDGAHYFSPLKVYEYLAAGLPVVASDVGSMAELVRPGETGLLVPGSQPAALAAAIDTLVGDPVTARAMGAAGRTLAETEHSWHAVLDRSVAGLGLPDPDRVGV